MGIVYLLMACLVGCVVSLVVVAFVWVVERVVLFWLPLN
jgi:hypothetical protein